MKINLALQLSAVLVSASAFSADMVITGVVDGPLSGGVPKAVEVYVVNDISDASRCGIGYAFNGGNSQGQRGAFAAAPVSAGSFLYVATETAGFNAFFGFNPDLVISSGTINGDDRVELYCDGTMVDSFGEQGVDGTGQPWEYLDGWAHRNAATTADGANFNLSHWSFSGINALDNQATNSSATTPYPLQSFVYGEESDGGSDDDTGSGDNGGGSGNNGGGTGGNGDTGGDTGGNGDTGGDTGGNGGDTGGGSGSGAPCFNCNAIDPVADPANFNDASYYSAALTAASNGSDAATLKAAINSAISHGQRVLSYSQVWTALTHTDEDPENANNVILLYSGRSMSKQLNGSGSQSSNPDNWNREHVWAKSHGFSDQSNEAYTDINHLRPADISINASRGNLDFDNSDNPLAEDPKNRIDNDSFEPRDAVKGDVARMLMYMDTRYEGNGDITPDLELVNRLTSTSEPRLGRLCRLLEWAKADPVDSFEIKRNNAIYKYQGNRNPYIDHPEWISQVYGDIQCDDSGDTGATPGDGDNGNTDPVTPPEQPVVLGQCSDPATLISAVQGSGFASPLVGQTVVVEGVVTAVNASANAFFLQEEAEHSDNNPATSEAVYIYNRNQPMPAVGSVVRLLGSVSEYYEKTEITLSGEYRTCGSGSVTPLAIKLPFSSAAAMEQIEGMLVSVDGDLLVTDNSSLGQYGEVTLSSKRLFTPTNVYRPGSAEATALAQANALDQLVLDDGNSQTYPSSQRYPNGAFSASNSLRTGDKVSSLVGVIDYSFDAYRLIPTQEPQFVASNPRPAQPGLALGDVTVASMNVLNLFNGDGNGAGFPTSRGANTAAEYERQVAKTVAAIVASNADVIGLMELENDGFGDNSAIADLVKRVNTALGDNSYAFINAGGTVGTDAITVGMLYRPAKLTTVGSVQLNMDSVFNRPPMAQTFQLAGRNEQFTVVVNHFKSKRCSNASGADADQNDGQSCFNATRVKQAQTLLQWFAADTNLSQQANKVIIGDLNSYAKEDPVTTLINGGFVDLINQFHGAEGYSYQYDGLLGYMDHMLVSPALAQTAVDAADWHINADEPTILDYTVANKSEQQQLDYYAADAYRMSDHDPVLASLKLINQLAPASCVHEITNRWQNGFQGLVRITNQSDNTIKGWQVQWGYSNGDSINSAWNGQLSGNGPYTASNLSWNQDIAPGQSVEVGFTGQGYGDDTSVTGDICQTAPVTPPSDGNADTPTAQCQYQLTNSWPGGFQGAVTITNTGNSDIRGWQVAWSFSDNSSVSSNWSALLSGQSPYTATNLEWNRVIKPGQSVQFGFIGQGSGQAGEVTGAICH
ncbi:ExeM/NucH family extracellular endonuclease [Shewanella sp. C32]|uniref:ExeM/NucH family extracellular endonuclease n=1 Tax=Shewanella electrica TaxID=515560 RepID=A0ABT2FMJ0_9GAMM|nr:ExeM/NucH family extracellular endonuclease [Shewanella electrica]MCH1926069.1 ExeM/NucH family extracellular endonuclease [Shewanella electrica]MCS4557562.1 ExeM/NucH family extracellular endonuclease [Shewanella electrica]